jgi:hypothetical protein
MKKEQSEFGRGLVICLVKFAEHFMSYYHILKSYERVEIRNAIQIWANGLSDHLYEIEVPDGKDWDEIRQRVTKLKKFGLEIGHGFTGEIYAKKDIQKLLDLTRDIALLIDKKIGLTPDIGKY